MKDKALKLALEALEVCEQSDYGRKWVWPETAHPTAMGRVRETITAIKQALEQSVQEPVGIVAVDGFGQIQIGWLKKPQHNDKLYTAAPVQEPDPCPGCHRGAVCRTPACGRLKLPIDHPYRTTQTAAPVQEPVAIPEYIREAATRLRESGFQEPIFIKAIVGWVNGASLANHIPDATKMVAAQPAPVALKPCRSPYCECSVGACSHPGFYDARNV